MSFTVASLRNTLGHLREPAPNPLLGHQLLKSLGIHFLFVHSRPFLEISHNQWVSTNAVSSLANMADALNTRSLEYARVSST